MAIWAGLILSFVAAAFAPLVHKAAPRAAHWILAIAPAGALALLVLNASAVGDGEVIRQSIAWTSELNLAWSFQLDGLSLLFATLITGVGLLVLLYTGPYMAGKPMVGRFLAYLLLFMGAMLGIVFSGHLLLIYVFWELTTISSWLLIGYENEKAEARAAAWQALIVTVAGGLCMLAGFILLGQAAGSYELSTLLERGERIRESSLAVPIMVLIAIGAFAKSGQVPLHFWLPNAMAAPTPVSAYLHSAAMVKAGVYLLARLHPALGDISGWTPLLVTVGSITMATGAWLAIVQPDLKRLLAYTTISALGMMVLLIGLGSEKAIAAMLLLVMAHALYKGCLFLVAGVLDHETGTRDVRRLGGLGRALPQVAVAAGLAWVSMVALPPTLGFIAHEAMLESTKTPSGAAGWLLTAAVTLASVLYVTGACVMSGSPFLGSKPKAPKPVHRADPVMWGSALVLGLLGIVLAGMPKQIEHYLIAPATRAAAGSAEHVDVQLWHGVTIALGLTLASVVAGVLLYTQIERVRRLGVRFAHVARGGPDRLYEHLIDGLRAVAAWQTQMLQHGKLSYYVLSIVAVIAATIAFTLAEEPAFTTGVVAGELPVADMALASFAAAGALGACVLNTRLGVIASMSTVGYVLAILFATYGAPDLAIVQFLVETLFVVLIVLLLPKLPTFRPLSSRGGRIGRFVVAAGFGFLMTLLVMATSRFGPDPRIYEYYVEHSVNEAHGRNVVNLILVDFRALDTVGEVTVLSTAAVGVYTLMRVRSGNGIS